MMERLKGMFAFALWDAAKKRLFLARDRMGEKPLYYAQAGDTFLFASELRALASHPNMPREIDPEALDLFLQFQCVPAPWSIYREARKLPPAHTAVFDENGLRISRYWRLDYTNKIAVGEQEAVEILESKIIDSIRLQRLADVPVGTALSGGVDSGLLTALTAQQTPDRVKTFTIAFREKDKDESEYARAVSERYNTEHHVLTVESDIQSLLPRIVRHHGEPFGDSSAIPTFHSGGIRPLPGDRAPHRGTEGMRYWEATTATACPTGAPDSRRCWTPCASRARRRRPLWSAATRFPSP